TTSKLKRFDKRSIPLYHALPGHALMAAITKKRPVPMPSRPKRRLSIARRAFAVVVFSVCVLFGGLALLLWWVYENLGTALAGQSATASAWTAAQNLVIGQAILFLPLALALLLGTLLVP